jgi:hypothetical protein
MIDTPAALRAADADKTILLQEFTGQTYYWYLVDTVQPYYLPGYPVDNVGPGAPECLAGEQIQSPMGLYISWFQNDERDLGGYKIYRGTSEEFVPGPGNLIAASYFPRAKLSEPLQPNTTIQFGLKITGEVSLRIYNAPGRLVRELVDGKRKADLYDESRDGKDDNGRTVSSGVYFYKLRAGSFTQTRKMVLL